MLPTMSNYLLLFTMLMTLVIKSDFLVSTSAKQESVVKLYIAKGILGQPVHILTIRTTVLTSQAYNNVGSMAGQTKSTAAHIQLLHSKEATPTMPHIA